MLLLPGCAFQCSLFDQEEFPNWNKFNINIYKSYGKKKKQIKKGMKKWTATEQSACQPTDSEKENNGQKYNFSRKSKQKSKKDIKLEEHNFSATGKSAFYYFCCFCNKVLYQFI